MSFLFVKGQDCKTIDSLTSFHKIKFGDAIPDELSKICDRVQNDYYLEHDSLDQGDKQKFERLFRFTNLTFSNLSLTSTSNGQFFSVTLWSVLNFIDSTDLANNKLPGSFTTLYNKLVSIFGSASKSQREDPSILPNYFGTTHRFIWDCDKIRLTLKLSYGRAIKETNTMEVEITDKRLEKKEALRELQN